MAQRATNADQRSGPPLPVSCSQVKRQKGGTQGGAAASKAPALGLLAGVLAQRAPKLARAGSVFSEAYPPTIRFPLFSCPQSQRTPTQPARAEKRAASKHKEEENKIKGPRGAKIERDAMFFCFFSFARGFRTEARPLSLPTGQGGNSNKGQT